MSLSNQSADSSQSKAVPPPPPGGGPLYINLKTTNYYYYFIICCFKVENTARNAVLCRLRGDLELADLKQLITYTCRLCI